MGASDTTAIKRRCLRAVLAVIAAPFVSYQVTAAWQVFKPLPDGLGMTGLWRPASSVRFHGDSTWLDGTGEQHTERRIFDAALAMIGRAEILVVADFFLINDFAGQAG